MTICLKPEERSMQATCGIVDAVGLQTDPGVILKRKKSGFRRVTDQIRNGAQNARTPPPRSWHGLTRCRPKLDDVTEQDKSLENAARGLPIFLSKQCHRTVFCRVHLWDLRFCLPIQSTSGCTTRICLVNASLRENVFSSVQR